MLNISESLRRNIAVANRLALILGFLSFAYLGILIANFGVSVTTPIIFCVGALFLGTIFLNNRGYFHIGRLLISTLPALITMYAALIAKLDDPSFTDILYYDARFVLLLLGIVPCLVFDIKEYGFLFSSLMTILCCLLLFDPIHEMLNVGYFQKGFQGRSYYYINYVSAIAFIGIAAGAVTLKAFIEKYETVNALFKKDLMEKNTNLTEALINIETQNEEIVSQSEELLASQEKLMEANLIIAQQNADLEAKVKQTGSELYVSNEELIKRNSELSQFSYTISHNLRGPIARLLGLVNVATFNANIMQDPDAMKIIEHIKTSATDLDNVIKDLTVIVDTRNSIIQNMQLLSLHEEWADVKNLLDISPDFEKNHFQVNFSAAPEIISVKPLLNSIIYNLISNSIKYKAYDRELSVSIRTFQNANFWMLQVEDNGLGLDMDLHQRDLFKMYKRFHKNLDGRGLGLYLMKLHVELLNGFIEVNSEVNVGTVFTVYLKKVGNTAEKVQV
jgi:signal transduction histidine kinase